MHEAVLGPTIPAYNGFNPAWGQVNAEQLWGNCHADVIKNGMTPAAAVDKAFKRAEAIFAKFTFRVGAAASARLDTRPGGHADRGD